MAYASAFREKMQEKGLQPEFINGWLGLYEKLCAGDKGFIPESSIEPVTELPELAELPTGDDALLAKTVILKLNGGLGTGMGLDKAKSLLQVKAGDSFLDLIAKQIISLRKKYPVRFMLMNSFSTEEDTREFFAKNPAYKEISEAWESEVSFMQNMSPKVDAASMQPAEWPAKPSCEWCPPGHGDIYAALVCSGQLQKLLAEGYKYCFVSNSDNLGATMDMRLLGYLASSDAPMLMEVCVRGEDDKKGGHLAREKATGKLTLRESAQCPKEDEKDFQNIGKHKFFNTNNLWLNLEKLQAAMSGGVLPLPVIVNEKKVDPASKENPGPKVFQLETAMGAAISSLEGSQAICVPFDRFAPVKTCNQLFGLRSDAYVVNSDFKPVLAPGATKPVVDFDDNYKMVPDMEVAIPHGVPSLKKCSKLTVKGKVVFAPGTVIEGEVQILAPKEGPAPTVSGHIRGSANKLRILRDADDCQNHTAAAAVYRGLTPRQVSGAVPVQTMAAPMRYYSSTTYGSAPLGATYVAAPPAVAAAPRASVAAPVQTLTGTITRQTMPAVTMAAAPAPLPPSYTMPAPVPTLTGTLRSVPVAAAAAPMAGTSYVTYAQPVPTRVGL